MQLFVEDAWGGVDRRRVEDGVPVGSVSASRVLDRQARAWLALTDPANFEALVMPTPSGGVLVVPTEGFARRVAAVTP